MISFRITTDVQSDRRVLLTLPPEVPIGPAELVVIVEQAPADHNHGTGSLADWVEAETGRDGEDQRRYPLRGSVARYDQPTEPVADTDWEALQ
jgi:hypothetical protein